MYTASEKLAIIRLVEDSELSIRRTLAEINVRVVSTAGIGLMNVMVLTGCTTTAGHHASTGTGYLTRYVNWW